MNTPAVEVKSVRHRFPGGREALRGIDLRIDRGSLTIIAGPNGSGKTVLMKHLNGLLKPTEGEILINGISTADDPQHARTKVGLVFQNSETQIIGQTVSEDIAFGPENLGKTAAEVDMLVKEIAKKLSITELLDESPHRLSGGSLKKVAAAGVIVMGAEIIVFDEPFAGLDYRGVRLLLGEILKLKDAGHTIILISHDLEKLLAHTDSLIIISEGRKAAEGSPADIIDRLEEFDIRRPAGEISGMTWLKEADI